MKKLYKGIFNWHGESYELFTHANSPDSAWLNFVDQMCKKVKLSKRTVMMYFNGDVDNYYIRRHYHETQNSKKVSA